MVETKGDFLNFGSSLDGEVDTSGINGRVLVEDAQDTRKAIEADLNLDISINASADDLGQDRIFASQNTFVTDRSSELDGITMI